MICVTRRRTVAGHSMGDKCRLCCQALRFAAVGLSGTAVNVGLLSLLYGQLHWPLPIGVMLATELAVFNNFVWNDRWTFGQRGISVQRLMRFNLSSLGGLAIASGTTIALVGSGVPYLMAGVIGVVSGAASNFATSVLWTWKTAS